MTAFVVRCSATTASDARSLPHAGETLAIPQERLDLLKLPKAIRDPINDLVRALKAASTREDIERENALEIAVILGLETAKRLKPADIEALYMIFDDVVQARLQKLAPDQ